MNDQSISIYFATVTGNAENCAISIKSDLAEQGITSSVHNLASSVPDSLRKTQTAIFVVSTWGDGEPPDDAVDFWNQILALPDGYFAGLRYALVALGDSAYDIFCGFGINLDKALERLGGVRIEETLLCDLSWEEPVRAWFPRMVKKLNLAETCS